MVLEYFGLLAASAAFEFGYVRWAKFAASDAVGKTVAYSVAVAGLGLLGLKGALELPGGWIAYLGGIGLGACGAAYLGRRERLGLATSAVG